MLKLRGAIIRLFDCIRQLPRRLFQVFQHLWKGARGTYEGLMYPDSSKNIPIEVGLWILELWICLMECFGIAEIYETLMDFVKFNTRPLYDWEIEVAQSVFGNSINYPRVRIDERAIVGPKQKSLCYVSFYIVNSWGSMHNSLLIHELIHIWQYERLGAVYIPRALRAQFSSAGYNYGGVKMLRSYWKSGKGLTDFNLEQQGDIVADYYRIRSGHSPHWGRGSAEDLPIYENFIRQLRH